ncbi:hypothetical protein D083_3290 [Dickeya solani RNS 08.23.3.1.A]|nr:hypothetical protein D083_3290 [Dickeya solani RNS 08.23.3.1.A]
MIYPICSPPINKANNNQNPPFFANQQQQINPDAGGVMLTGSGVLSYFKSG